MRAERGKGLYEVEKLWVDRLALLRMESWVQATGLTFKGLPILLERFYGVASQHGQAMQARSCLSIEHAHSMRDTKEALTVAIDRSGVGSGEELIKTEEQKQAN